MLSKCEHMLHKSVYLSCVLSRKILYRRMRLNVVMTLCQLNYTFDQYCRNCQLRNLSNLANKGNSTMF